MSDDLPAAPKRCAIYTRKSTNTRLEREVNSLTTQHEICSAYFASQRYRGLVGFRTNMKPETIATSTAPTARSMSSTRRQT